MSRFSLALVIAMLCMACEKTEMAIADPLCPEGPVNPNVPALRSPACGSELENGCRNSSKAHTWQFEWDEFPEASKYHINIKHAGSSSSLVDEEVTESQFTRSGSGYIVDRNRRDWYWQVRAFVNGQWTAWSERRVFHVKPLIC